MRFLHEYNIYNDGTKKDNGYWLIDGDRLINRCGGWHDYKPSEDDEILEVDSWDDIIKLTIRDDSKTTGWIAPDGTFYGCNSQEHDDMARYFFGSSERSLENKGYIKVFENPRLLRVENPNLPRYEYWGRREPTDKQWETLVEKGLVENNGY